MEGVFELFGHLLHFSSISLFLGQQTPDYFLIFVILYAVVLYPKFHKAKALFCSAVLQPNVEQKNFPVSLNY